MRSRQMQPRLAGRLRQRGFALILMAMIVIMGVVYYALGALGKGVTQGYERDQVTAASLKKAKEALLGYIAQTAAMTTDAVDSRHTNPGRLPCPESLSHAGTANEGIAADLTAAYNCGNIGRLPWKSLGVDQIRDGYGEPLWYAVPQNTTWAKTTSATPLTINPSLGNQLTYDGTPSVVAVIIAPGAPLNTNGTGTPTGTCSGYATINQLSATRNTAPLVAGNFVECGNAAASPSYTSIGTPPWSNDRSIAITAAEVMDAISGAVADRLQRQVAPALQDWYTAQSTAWGLGRSFFPYASSFNTLPAANTLCGSLNTNEGLLPTALAASGNCNTAWGGGNVSSVLLTLIPAGCAYTGAAMQCTFWGFNATFLSALFKARVTATASNIASSFRAPIALANITASPAVGTTVDNFSITLNPATGVASLSFDVSGTIASFGFVVYTVTVPNVSDAAILSDARTTWFINNGWQRYTYYHISTAANANPGANTCTAAGGNQCLTISNLPSVYGQSDDKRFVLTLLGRAVTGQTQPSTDPMNYLESHTVLPTSTTYTFNPAGISTSITNKVVSSTFNDRHAACPFSFNSGTTTVCN